MTQPVSVFTEKYYEDTAFTSLSLPDASLTDIEFFRCRFDSCQFLRTVFCRCRFEACVFQKCDLSLLQVTDCRFVDAKFVKSKMLGIDWTRAAKPLAIALHGCNVSHSVFVELHLPKLEMTECVAREVDFTGVHLTKANLSRTDFLGSRFIHTDLSCADFSQAVNYSIDPTVNRVKKAVFTLPEAMSLLSAFDIILQ